MIARRNFLLRFLGLLATVSLPVAARAERKRAHAATDSPEAPSKKNETAQLRLWKATDTPEHPVIIRLLLPGKPDAAALSPLKADGGYYQLSNYVEVPAGALVAEVSAPGRPTLLLPLPLAAGGQSTLLVRLQNANLSAEWIDDAAGPADGGCEFRVYNLLPAINDLQISLGTALVVHLTSTRSNLHLVGIKPNSYPLAVLGTISAGKNFQWNSTVDFGQCRKATLLFCADSYGRMTPRLDTV